jgi:hypothetical protein
MNIFKESVNDWEADEARQIGAVNRDRAARRAKHSDPSDPGYDVRDDPIVEELHPEDFKAVLNDLKDEMSLSYHHTNSIPTLEDCIDNMRGNEITVPEMDIKKLEEYYDEFKNNLLAGVDLFETSLQYKSTFAELPNLVNHEYGSQVKDRTKGDFNEYDFEVETCETCGGEGWNGPVMCLTCDGTGAVNPKLEALNLKEEVVDADFGRKPMEGIEVPVDRQTGEAFASFEVQKVSKTTSYIIGIHSDGSKKRVSATQTKFADILVDAFNNKGMSRHGIKKVSMTPKTIEIFQDAGAKFAEKPTSFEQIRAAHKISQEEYQKILQQNGLEIPNHYADDIFGDGFTEAEGPLSDAKEIDSISTITFSDTGHTYLTWRAGAASYIRIWLFIDTGELSVFKEGFMGGNIDPRNSSVMGTSKKDSDFHSDTTTDTDQYEHKLEEEELDILDVSEEEIDQVSIKTTETQNDLLRDVIKSILHKQQRDF